jgi:hypothetical protein
MKSIIIIIKILIEVLVQENNKIYKIMKFINNLMMKDSNL